jgi:4-hydroxybenzoate polyprenyltransferase
MTLGTALRLGRVSNLPTVWTNVLAGIVLGGGTLAPVPTVLLLVALSLFYVGGMYLNDWFDREVDARERPERPIPSGAVAAAAVRNAGVLLFAAGEACAVRAAWRAGAVGPTAIAGLALAATIVWYDARHKGVWFAPVVMGLCRVLVYVVAALATGGAITGALTAGAALLLAYLIGLTYAARQETLARLDGVWPLGFLAVPFVAAPLVVPLDVMPVAIWVAFLIWVVRSVGLLAGRPRRDVPAAVGRLIAGISLLDGLLLAANGQPGLAVLAVAAVPLTRALQRHVPGT